MACRSRNMSRPSPSPASSRRASCRAMTRSRTRPRSSTMCSASSPSPISAATTSPISRPTRSATTVLGGGVDQDKAPGFGEGARRARPRASVVSRGLVRSKADKLMLVRERGRGGVRSRRRLRRAWRLRPGRDRAEGRARRARRATSARASRRKPKPSPRSAPKRG